MKKVLSVDFDYFIDTDLDTRNSKFPDGYDEMSEEELKRQWDYFYKEYPEIKDIGVTPQYFEFLEYLRNHCFLGTVCADSHKHIMIQFNLMGVEDVKLTHIDFHHDNYISGGSRVDCANWLRHAKEFNPSIDVTWIRREDSEVSSLTGEFPYKHTTEFILEDEYDIVFLCFSPEWTPPHLRGYYNALVCCLLG